MFVNRRPRGLFRQTWDRAVPDLTLMSSSHAVGYSRIAFIPLLPIIIHSQSFSAAFGAAFTVRP